MKYYALKSVKYGSRQLELDLKKICAADKSNISAIVVLVNYYLKKSFIEMWADNALKENFSYSGYREK